MCLVCARPTYLLKSYCLVQEELTKHNFLFL